MFCGKAFLYRLKHRASREVCVCGFHDFVEFYTLWIWVSLILHALACLYFVLFLTSSLRGLLLFYVGEWLCSEDVCEWPPLLRHKGQRTELTQVSQLGSNEACIYAESLRSQACVLKMQYLSSLSIHVILLALHRNLPIWVEECS